METGNLFMYEKEGKKRLNIAVVAIFLGLIVGGIVLAYVLITGPSRRAKEVFGSTYDCPAERIELQRRKDIRGSQFSRHSPPDAEVVADPGRYAVWKKKDDERRKIEDGGGNYGVYIYEVRGCGHTELYLCSSKPSCSSKKYPEGVGPI